jgi:hypothetical protein
MTEDGSVQGTVAWVPVTKELLQAQHPWLYKPMWIAMKDGSILMGRYEWRQGRNPDRFLSDGVDEWAYDASHVMPLLVPAHPSTTPPSQPVATVPDNSQDWAGLDGATAFQLIERHANGWGDIRKMMGEWLAANAPLAASAQPAVQPTPKDFEEFVKAELGDIAVSDNGRYISPKIQNYWKIWEHCKTTPPPAPVQEPEQEPVADAMARYLRVCSTGGMPEELQESVQNLVCDAERLGYFKAATPPAAQPAPQPPELPVQEQSNQELIQQASAWAERWGQAVFAGGGMLAVEEMNAWAQSMHRRKATQQTEQQEQAQMLAEADRRAGAAERELASCREDLVRLDQVRDKMKKQWGVDRNVSFDKVWAEALKLKQQQPAKPLPTVDAEFAKGETLEEMRSNISPDFWKKGDARLMWVNEGSYLAHKFSA